MCLCVCESSLLCDSSTDTASMTNPGGNVTPALSIIGSHTHSRLCRRKVRVDRGRTPWAIAQAQATDTRKGETERQGSERREAKSDPFFTKGTNSRFWPQREAWRGEGVTWEVTSDGPLGPGCRTACAPGCLTGGRPLLLAV